MVQWEFTPAGVNLSKNLGDAGDLLIFISSRKAPCHIRLARKPAKQDKSVMVKALKKNCYYYYHY